MTVLKNNKNLYIFIKLYWHFLFNIYNVIVDQILGGMKKNKLNEQEEEKVSGGYYHFSDDGTFERTENNKRYDLYCDFCNKKMEGNRLL